jgi:hypothetical protein
LRLSKKLFPIWMVSGLQIQSRFGANLIHTSQRSGFGRGHIANVRGSAGYSPTQTVIISPVERHFHPVLLGFKLGIQLKSRGGSRGVRKAIKVGVVFVGSTGRNGIGEPPAMVVKLTGTQPVPSTRFPVLTIVAPAPPVTR